MKSLTILLTFLLSLASAFAAQIDFKSLASGQFQITGSDFNRSATNNKQVNIYKNGDYIEQIQLNRNGSFSYTSPKDTFKQQDQITVKVLQYISQSQHFEKSAFYNFSHGNHSIEFTSLSNGQMTAVGRNFNSPYVNNKQVNFYKNGDFFAQIFLNDNGSFSYTTPARTFRDNDKFTIKVLQYIGTDKHFEKTGTYQFNSNPVPTNYACIQRAKELGTRGPNTQGLSDSQVRALCDDVENVEETIQCFLDLRSLGVNGPNTGYISTAGVIEICAKGKRKAERVACFMENREKGVNGPNSSFLTEGQLVTLCKRSINANNSSVCFSEVRLLGIDGPNTTAIPGDLSTELCSYIRDPYATIECFKEARLLGAKGPSEPSLRSDLKVELCKGARSADAPVSCFKTIRRWNDSDVQTEENVRYCSRN